MILNICKSTLTGHILFAFVISKRSVVDVIWRKKKLYKETVNV